MNAPHRSFFHRPALASGASFFGVLVVEYGLWRLAGGPEQRGWDFWLFWLIAILLAVTITGLTQAWLNSRLVRQTAQQDLAKQKKQFHGLEQRLDGMVRLNQLVIDAQSEKELVENALEVIAGMTMAVGCSFMPFDEWGQPLGTYTYGEFPAPVLRAWAEHLSNNAVRNRCRVCQKLESRTGEVCPLLEMPFSDSIRVYCLPLNRDERIAGMLNIYLPFDHPLDEEFYKFLVVLLRELVLAVEMIRLRGKELATLQQLHMLDNEEETLQTTITRLLEGLSDALDFEAARIDFKTAPPQFPGLQVIYGELPWLNSAEADAIISDLLASDCPGPGSRVFKRLVSGELQTIIAPCCLPEGGVIGAMILAAGHPVVLRERQVSLVETVTVQAAVLVENVRKQLDREYRVVIQERVRLAREIHDSLAQTLAYLKLTAAQMQSQLANGDLTRLEQSINQSYKALSDAYLETRQAIDNLRLAPLKSMGTWVDQLVQDFQTTSGLKAASSVPDKLPDISSEIQAQLLRIVQEALSNARKHAQASQVWVNLRTWNGDLILEISDDGIGFSAEDVPEFSRHGLRGMRERAELIGADFQITSQPNKGTTIRLQLPLNIEETPA